MNVSSNKANASFNQYVIARHSALAFLLFSVWRGTICYIFFICCLVILCLSRTCPVLVLYLS